MAIGMPDNSIKAETAWGNPVVTKKVIKAVKEAGFNAIRIPVRWHAVMPTWIMWKNFTDGLPMA